MIDCRGFQELFPCDYDSIRCRKTDREFSYCSDNDSTYLLGVRVETWRDGCFESRDFPAEYTPLEVKQAVVGYGKAEKHQVMDMTRRFLHMEKMPRPDDAADAIAIALCHARSATSMLSRTRGG